MKKLALIALALIISFTAAFAGSDSLHSMRMQMKNSEGREFWLCFMKNYEESRNNREAEPLMLEFFITSEKDAEVFIEIKSLNFKKSVDIKGGTVENVKITPNAEMKSFEIIEQSMAIHITSDNPVTVYGLSHMHQTTDTYLALPVEVLGTEYRAMCYSMSEPLMPEFAVIATENNTIVEINPTVETAMGKKAGETFTVTLNKGDVYQVSSKLARLNRLKCDLTGSMIKSNKKIAVFSGHMCAYVPAGPPRIMACNHLIEQMPPTNTWGKHFFVGRFEKRSFYTYRVLANYPNTKVFENSQLLQTLGPGEFLERNSDRSIQVSADKPVLVSQYSQGFNNKDSIGDPMMLLVSPTQQFLKRYRVVTPINGDWDHYLNIVVPTVAIRTFRLNGEPVDTAKFVQLGLSRYSIAYLKVPFGSHSVTCDLPFGLYSYGFGYKDDAFDAYGSMGGQSFIEYEPAKDTLPPMAEQKYDNGFKIIFRDDRVDDAGIKELNVLDNSGIDITYSSISEGQPQLAVDFKPLGSTARGRMLLQIKDAALNSAIYTVCYSLDRKTGDFSFSLSEGSTADCIPDPGWLVGGFLKYSAFFHSPDFSKSGGIAAKGKFSSAVGSGGYFGVLLSRELKPSVIGTLSLSIENYGGKISAPDSVMTHIRDTRTGELKSFQESAEIKLSGIFFHLSAMGEYHFKSHLYALAGLELCFAGSKSVDYTTRILRPNDFTYSNGRKVITPAGSPDMLNSLKSARLDGFAGIGFNYPVNFRLNAFAEGIYAQHFSSLIDDGTWNLNRLSFRLGLKYRI